MRILFYGSVLLTGIITIASIGFVQLFTSVFDPHGYNPPESNGNPALFFIVFPMPFLAYFFFSMIFVFEKLHQRFAHLRKQLIAFYSILFVAIVGATIYRLDKFRQMAQPYFDYDIGYITPYSNHLLVNGWTFIAALCISALISFYFVRTRKAATLIVANKHRETPRP